MPETTSILVFGRDLSLLETRTWVLQGAGFEVSATADRDEAVRAVSTDEVGLTILCHSLLPEDRTAIFEAAGRADAKPRILAMTGGIEGLPEDEGLVLLSPFEGPRALIGTVTKILNEA